MLKTRRLRGVLLRLALSRFSALTSGLGLLGPAILMATVDYSWESWFSDGLGLIAAGTGAALVLIALQSRRSDGSKSDSRSW